MNYDRIYHNDVLNGKGFRVVLFLMGCSHKCAGCYNKETWNPRNGQPFTEEVMADLMQKLSEPQIDGLTLTGGDPLFRDNLEGVLSIVERVRSELPEKNIWMWTGYTLEEATEHPVRRSILEQVDCLVDGRYVQENPTRKPFRGSDNQRLIAFKKNSIEIENIA